MDAKEISKKWKLLIRAVDITKLIGEIMRQYSIIVIFHNYKDQSFWYVDWYDTLQADDINAPKVNIVII